MRFIAQIVLLSCLFPILLVAKPSAEESTEEDREAEIRWSLSGQVRFRGEWRDDLDLNQGVDDDSRSVLSRLRLGLSVGIQEDYRFFFQVQDSRVFGEETTTTSNEQNLDLHQGYLDLWRQRRQGWSLRIGRQEWIYGDERLIGALGWGNEGRSFDGIQIRYQGGDYRVDTLWSRISSRANPSGGTAGSDLYGIYSHFACARGAVYEAYALAFIDNLQLPGETGVPGTTDVYALGGRAVNRFGRLDTRFEGTAETGTLRGDNLEAYAAAVVVGYTFPAESSVRAFGGYDFATGDENSSDGRTEEFFNFFPTNHKHYGYADLEGWRNLRSYYGGVSVQKAKHWAQAKFHRFSLEEPAGPWRNAGGVILGLDPTGQSGRSVGWEVDLNYRFIFLKKSSLEAGLSRFAPGRFARSTRGPDPSYWAYIMLTVGF